MLMEIEKDKLIDMCRTMVRIRTFEERLIKEFAKGVIICTNLANMGRSGSRSSALPRACRFNWFLTASMTLGWR